MKRKNKNFPRRNAGSIGEIHAPEPSGTYAPFPPSYTPRIQPSRACSDSHAIQKAPSPDVLAQYLFCYIYIWLNDYGEGYWTYPVMINNDMLHAYIWDGYEWVYTYMYLSQIAGFY